VPDQVVGKTIVRADVHEIDVVMVLCVFLENLLD
jgi:hypothetical protein